MTPKDLFLIFCMLMFMDFHCCRYGVSLVSMLEKLDGLKCFRIQTVSPLSAGDTTARKDSFRGNSRTLNRQVVPHNSCPSRVQVGIEL